MNLKFFEVTGSSTKIVSPYDGYIGIMPWFDLELESKDKMDQSFIYNLKEGGHIDHPVISMWISSDSSKDSLIKFGSWDKNGLAKGEKLQVV
mmetsp:Transcript_5724/g.9094  ORF Transcript_5724/g.9094 Transcript_5724/m.9094 type:complete len:92 (+) Transcript_5724:398-673(+)